MKTPAPDCWAEYMALPAIHKTVLHRLLMEDNGNLLQSFVADALVAGGWTTVVNGYHRPTENAWLATAHWLHVGKP